MVSPLPRAGGAGGGLGSPFPVIGVTCNNARRPVKLLDQHRAFEGVETVWDAAATAYRDVIALEQSLAEQAAKLAELGEPPYIVSLGGHDDLAILLAVGFDTIEHLERGDDRFC